MVDPELAERIVSAARRWREHVGKGDDWAKRRDELIIEALQAGASQREVARLAGLSQPSVHDIWHRHLENSPR